MTQHKQTRLHFTDFLFPGVLLFIFSGWDLGIQGATFTLCIGTELHSPTLDFELFRVQTSDWAHRLCYSFPLLFPPNIYPDRSASGGRVQATSRLNIESLGAKTW